MIEEQWLRALDDKLTEQDVPLHARPLLAAIEWMRANAVTGNILSAKVHEPLMQTYRRLHPKGDFSIPPLFEAGIAIRDRFYPVHIRIVYGRVQITPIDSIVIDRSELEQAFARYTTDAWKAFYGVCDLWDFAYGVDDLVRLGSAGGDLLMQARSQIAATARILAGRTDLEASIQSSCLAAELSMKGVLRHLGSSERELKRFGHNLRDLAEGLCSSKPGPSDDRLRQTLSGFPDYVASRYQPQGLSRLRLMELAMRAQFVVADVTRRASDRNFGALAEADKWNMPRPTFG
ncbi:hypothetical protein D3C87_1162670 [compost metagenome]